jgi:hypothetical protein
MKRSIITHETFDYYYWRNVRLLLTKRSLITDEMSLITDKMFIMTKHLIIT